MQEWLLSQRGWRWWQRHMPREAKWGFSFSCPSHTEIVYASLSLEIEAASAMKSV